MNATTSRGGVFGALATFLRLPAATKELAVEAAVLLALARFLVMFVPMRRWRHRIATARQERLLVPPLARKVAWVVRKVADFVPFGAACLPQALAAQWMLRWRGVASQLMVGVRREATADRAAGRFYHAWLQVGDQCVIGCNNIGTYAAFPPFEPVERGFAKQAN